MDRRMTVVAGDTDTMTRSWRSSKDGYNRVVVLQFAMLRHIVQTISAAEHDVARLVVDGGTSADCLLDLLAVVDPDFGGDVMWIRPDGSGYLSATTRSAGRTLYALKPADVAFYLMTHELVAPSKRGADVLTA